MKIRLIWDACTPTRERRPTTSDDIRDDINVEEFDSEKDFVDTIIGITGIDIDEIEDADGETPFEKAKSVMGWCDDPGDGSPNFLYLSVDGVEDKDVTLPYDCLEKLDLETCSKDDVIEACISDFAEDDFFDDLD